LAAEDIKITTHLICSSGTPGGQTVLKDGLTRNKGTSRRFVLRNRRAIMSQKAQDLKSKKKITNNNKYKENKLLSNPVP
jgi:hypothetical protein